MVHIWVGLSYIGYCTGSARYSDRSIFRQVDIPTGRYSDRSIFRQVDIPTGRYSDRSIFRQVDIPTGRYSDRSIFRQVDIPTGRYSDRSIFRQVDIPTGRYSDRSIFRQVDIPTGLYSDRSSIFRQVCDIPTKGLKSVSNFSQIFIELQEVSRRLFELVGKMKIRWYQSSSEVTAVKVADTVAEISQL